MWLSGYDAFLDEVRARAGLATRDEAERAARATLETLSERLTESDLLATLRQVPRPVAAMLRARPYERDFPLKAFYERVAAREGVRLGPAAEHAQVVCQVLAEAIDPAARRQLVRFLPPPFARLFDPRQPAPPPPLHPEHPPRPRGHTLADGRPGSSRPIAEAAPPRGQTHSVALSTNPHGDRKISSAT